MTSQARHEMNIRLVNVQECADMIADPLKEPLTKHQREVVADIIKLNVKELRAYFQLDS